MWNSDGSPRTNCDLSKFTVRSWRNGTSIVQSWSFRNQSTGDYTATRVPNAPGFHKMIYYYNNTTIGTFTEMVRLYDIDTYYASSGPRFADISGNLSGAAQAFVAVRTTLNNMTGFVHTTNTKVATLQLFRRIRSCQPTTGLLISTLISRPFQRPRFYQATAGSIILIWPYQAACRADCG